MKTCFQSRKGDFYRNRAKKSLEVLSSASERLRNSLFLSTRQSCPCRPVPCMFCSFHLGTNKWQSSGWLFCEGSAAGPNGVAATAPGARH